MLRFSEVKLRFLPGSYLAILLAGFLGHKRAADKLEGSVQTMEDCTRQLIGSGLPSVSFVLYTVCVAFVFALAIFAFLVVRPQAVQIRFSEEGHRRQPNGEDTYRSAAFPFTGNIRQP